MTFLFDVGEQKKKKPAKRPQPQAQPVAVPATSVASVVSTIGSIDGSVTCDCGADHFDIVDSYHGAMKLQCAFCGAYTTCANTEGTASDSWIFSVGRFIGMTIAQVSNTPVGFSYLKWAAANSPRDDERTAVTLWLDQHDVHP